MIYIFTTATIMNGPSSLPFYKEDRDRWYWIRLRRTGIGKESSRHRHSIRCGIRGFSSHAYCHSVLETFTYEKVLQRISAHAATHRPQGNPISVVLVWPVALPVPTAAAESL